MAGLGNAALPGEDLAREPIAPNTTVVMAIVPNATTRIQGCMVGSEGPGMGRLGYAAIALVGCRAKAIGFFHSLQRKTGSAYRRFEWAAPRELHEEVHLMSNHTRSPKMPVLFVGHGSPMNAMESNAFTNSLRKLGRELPRPRAICVISAHWVTRGSRVQASAWPPTIHDFYGFPKPLYELQYPAPGAPDLAKRLAFENHLVPDQDWGLDHG